jgi:twitching motility protein PilI
MAQLKLREFQEYLATRLNSAARGEISSALLGVQSGTHHWLLKLDEAGEILPMPPLSPVPLTQSWFAGMANIRGNLYSVIDFAAFRGEEPTPRTSHARLVLLGARFGINSAILVHRMLGLRPADSFTATDLPADQAWINGVLTDAEGRQWQRLDVPTLLVDPKFMQIGL